jgi:polynucleotide 5'-kinase involved in rRNA processing
MKMKDFILTNSDFSNIEIVKAYYLNTPTPNLNMKYYNTCVERLMLDYKQIKSKQNTILIVNTCGWVEGLGT